eukprot:3239426-Rhodomonas_salina.3
MNRKRVDELKDYLEQLGKRKSDDETQANPFWLEELTRLHEEIAVLKDRIVRIHREQEDEEIGEDANSPLTLFDVGNGVMMSGEEIVAEAEEVATRTGDEALMPLEAEDVLRVSRPCDQSRSLKLC